MTAVTVEAGDGVAVVSKRLLRMSGSEYRVQLEREGDEIVRHAGEEPARTRLAAFASHR